MSDKHHCDKRPNTSNQTLWDGNDIYIIVVFSLHVYWYLLHFTLLFYILAK